MAAVTAGVIAVGTGVYSAYENKKALDAAADDRADIRAREWQHASDIVDQIELEADIYSDELEMINKANKLAEDKSLRQVSSAIDQTGDRLSDIVGQSYKSKYEGGASQRVRKEARDLNKKSITDLSKDFEFGLRELALKDEEAKRDAEIRHETIIGQLESQYYNLTGQDMPNPSDTQPEPYIETEEDNRGKEEQRRGYSQFD